ncbi:MAG: glycosyltransferase family 4 protein, partial [Candidatus Omnitrophica bacterium]|nr:glycosyltransferase family 4 protein [Candidatus Omnitrophota bacterium]
RKTLEKRAKSLGIGDTVVFTGLLPPEQIPKVISIFDLLVHVSLREGLPKTVAQGLAAGKPIVAFDVDGAKEIVIDGKTGYLVPVKDTKKLALTIIKALENKTSSVEMAREGQKLIKKLFPIEVMVDSIEEVYKGLCGT